MSGLPNDASISRAVAAARGNLPAEDVAKLERLARSKESLKGLTSGMSERDWAAVMKVINDPELLRRVMSSPQGKSVLHDFLKRLD